MPILLIVASLLHGLNDRLLQVGKIIGVIALAIMVCLILGQVFFRYVLNDAPNWTEEAARFGMLWMTGLLAPIALRQGGFVAIDMVERALPRVLSNFLTLFLLAISLWALIILWDKGLNNHVDSLSGRGKSASLRIPLDLFGGESIKFRNNWQYASLFVGVNLMILVMSELIVRQVIKILGGGDQLPQISNPDAVRAD